MSPRLLSSSSGYDHEYRRSLEDPVDFWGEAAAALEWVKPPSVILDDSRAPFFYRWFSDGILSICHNALDRHVRDGRGSQVAISYASPISGSKQQITYSELLGDVARFAGSLRSQGVGQGDRVLIYMPMIPEAIVAMLACARLGAVHSVAFGGFGSKELAVRVDDATPKAVVWASCGLEPNRVVHYKPLLDEALKIATHQVDFTVLVQRKQAPVELVPGRDLLWERVMENAEPVDNVPMLSTDPLYLLYTRFAACVNY